jgi:hypothetical protein
MSFVALGGRGSTGLLISFLTCKGGSAWSAGSEGLQASDPALRVPFLHLDVHIMLTRRCAPGCDRRYRPSRVAPLVPSLWRTSLATQGTDCGNRPDQLYRLGNKLMNPGELPLELGIGT